MQSMQTIKNLTLRIIEPVVRNGGDNVLTQTLFATQRQN